MLPIHSAIFLTLVLFEMVIVRTYAQDFAHDYLRFFEYIKNAQLKLFIPNFETDWGITYRGNATGTDPISGMIMNIPFSYIKSKRNHLNRPAPLLIILPPIIGQTFMDNDIARHYAQKGYHVLIALMPEDVTDPSRPISDVNNFLIRLTISGRMLIDIFTQRKEVDPSKIALIGTSLGGIRSAYLLGAEPRVRGAITFVAGGNIPHILTYGESRKIAKWRSKRMKHEQISSLSECYTKITQFMKVDPIDLAKFRNPEDIFMIIGKKDEIVPAKDQMALWEAYRKPQAVFFSLGHVPTALTWRFVLSDMDQYLHKLFYPIIF